MEAKAAPRSGRRWGAVRMAEAGRTPDAACDALGEVARADESQAERIRGSGGGLDGRRRHRREGSAAGFSQCSGDDDAWVVDLAGAPDPTLYK
jgi:hypothetical protein